MSGYDITLHIEDGEVTGVTSPLGQGSPVTDVDLSPYKKSLYGLRHLTCIRNRACCPREFDGSLLLRRSGWGTASKGPLARR